MDKNRLFFDWNSTTRVAECALAAMTKAYHNGWANPSSTHYEGRQAKQQLEEARAHVAALVGAKTQDVLFTSGGTEATNIALHSLFAQNDEGDLAVLRTEHASAQATARLLAQRGVQVHWINVQENGVIRLDHLEDILKNRTVRMVCTQAVNGETGVCQPLERIYPLCKQYDAALHVDVVQAVGKCSPPGGGWLTIADTLSIAAHKIQGPKGIGALVTRRAFPVQPVLRGGSQERGLRPGTQDAALASAFAAVAQLAADSPVHYERLRPIRDELEENLIALGAKVNGAGAIRVPHVLHVSFAQWEAAELVSALDLEGFAVSAGSACHAGVTEPSATLKAMWGDNLAEQGRLKGTLRISMGPTTTQEEAHRLLFAIRRVIGRT